MNLGPSGNERGRETIMQNFGRWVAVTTLLTSAFACGGRQLNDVGDVNSEQGGNAGNGEQGGSAGNGGSAGAPKGGAGRGGMTGDGGSMPGTGGSGAQSGAGGVGGSGGSCASGNGCFYQEGNDVRALAADDTNLYWVEYGTHDELGNYNNDGRLRARAFDSEEVRTLAEGLEGPIRVDLTTTHVYVFVDQYWEDGLIRVHLRVPIGGGDREFVGYNIEDRDGSRLFSCMHCLVHSGGSAYWPEIDGIWRATETQAEGQNLVSLSGQTAFRLAVSGDQLLFVIRDEEWIPSEIYSVPLDGGTSARLSADARLPFTVAGNYLYGIDWPSFQDSGRYAPLYYISLSPAAGGPWTRLVEHDGFPLERLEVVGDLVFHDRRAGASAYIDATRLEVVQGTLEDPEAGGALIGFENGTLNDWIGTPSGIYWTSGDGIYVRHNVR